MDGYVTTSVRYETQGRPVSARPGTQTQMCIGLLGDAAREYWMFLTTETVYRPYM
jgi:hypothetical protein